MEEVNMLAQQFFPGVPIGLVLFLIAWSLVWKGFALWRAGRKNHVMWFILIFILNTAGILEILYLFVFSKIDLDEKPVRGSGRKSQYAKREQEVKARKKKRR